MPYRFKSLYDVKRWSLGSEGTIHTSARPKNTPSAAEPKKNALRRLGGAYG